MQNKLYILGLVLVFVLILPYPDYAQDEKLKLSTYYPSPFGSYRNLNVSNILAVGPVNPDNIWGVGVARPGTLLLSGTNAGLNIMDRNAGAWTGAPGNIFTWYAQGGLLRLSTGILLPSGVLGIGDILHITSNGTVMEYVTPDHLNGCYRMSYGSSSGRTSCPTGTVDSTLSVPNPAYENGGYFYCCS